jgi:hypothetical protein
MKQVYQLLPLTFILLLVFGCQKDLSYERAFGCFDNPNNISGSVKVFGSYNINRKLTSANYFEEPVYVFLPGPYHIKTDILNGYSFAADGVFTHIGKDTIKLIGTGTPISASTNGFSVSFDTSQTYIDVTINGIEKYKSTLTYNLDGVPTVAQATRAYVFFGAFDHQLSINGISPNSNLWVILENMHGEIEPGIYNCLTANKMTGRLDYFTNDLSFPYWTIGTELAGSSILISIDQISTTHVSGTFNGIVKSENSSGTASKTISNGVFDLPIY